MKLNISRIVLYLAFTLVVAGILVNGISPATIERAWNDIVARPGGAMALRFLLQPTMSLIFALRDGIEDARTNRSPYFWTIVSNPKKRLECLQDGLDATGKIILIAIALDTIYQYIEQDTFYPLEALIVAILLAFIPYFIFRGPIGRIARWWMNRSAAS